MEPIYGKAPIIGYAVSVEDLKTDFNLYDSMYKASMNGQTMPKDQLTRYAELKAALENNQSDLNIAPK